MVSVKINLDGARRKLSAQSLDRGRYALANQAMADMNQFVPMDEGNLRQASAIGADGKSITYNMPYAANLFYMYKFNYTTPGTGPRWDLKAKSVFMSDWIEAFTKGADW